MTRRRRIAIGLAVAVAAAIAVYAWLASRLDDPRPSVLGARLGMTPQELRSRVEAEQPGTWTASVVDGDWVLDRRGGAVTARFELHEGQLVAVRAEGPRSTALLDTPAFEVTAGSVLVRSVDHERVQITLLSRACPTHHDEAEALVRAHAAPP